MAAFQVAGCAQKGHALDEDLIDIDSDSVLAMCYSDLHRLPTPAEYETRYKALLRLDKISNPLPSGWSVTLKSLGKEQPSWKLGVLVTVRAADQTFKHVDDLDTR